jgi:glycosyltransferase involved in cell wall biosynthesis
MQIGLDVRTVLAAKTGDRTYALTLLHGLAALNLDPQQWQFHLLLDAPDTNGLLPSSLCFRTVVLPARNSRLWTLLTLPRYAREARLDLVHVQYLAPRGLPCPFVTTIHDVVWRALPGTFPPLHRTILTRFMPGVARRAALILCGTESAKRDIARWLRVRKQKLTVTPYAIEPRYIEIVEKGVSPTAIQESRTRHGLGNEPYVLSVGVRQPRKNLARLQAAFAQLKDVHPELPHRLVIVGKEGWGEEANAIPHDTHTVFTGYVPDEDLPALYAGAETFAYPSLYEGFGLPIVEAQACGCPVLTSNISSLPEAAGEVPGSEGNISIEHAAVLVDPFSVQAIAQGLEELLTDPTLRETLRAHGRVHAAECTPERLARATLEAYRIAFRTRS